MIQSLKKNWLVFSNKFCKVSPNHSKVQKFHFDRLFLSKVFEVWAKKIFHVTEQWCKIWINPELLFSKMIWGIGWTFIRALKVWKIMQCGFFLSKAYNVSAARFQRNYVSWHWRVMQNLKENWLVAWKWHNYFG